MNNKKEVVVFHDLAEIEAGGKSKTLVWVGTQTFTIEYLDENGVNSEKETDQEVNEGLEKQAVVDIRNGSRKVQRNNSRLEVEPKKTARTAKNASNADCQDHLASNKEKNEFENIQNVGGDLNHVKYVDSSVNSKDLPSTVCGICKKNFSSDYVRKRHMLTHFGIKLYRCNHCLKHFSQTSGYYAHKCSKNPTGFNQTPSVGPSRARCTTIVDCHVCGKLFRGLYLLKRHETLHTGERPYKCDKCHRTFSQWTGKQKHCCAGFVNRNFVPFACGNCCKTFKDEKYLLAHQQFHYLDAHSDLENFPENAVQGELNESGDCSIIDLESSVDAAQILRDLF